MLMAGCISSPTKTILPEPAETLRPLPTLSSTETQTPSPTLLTSTPTLEPTPTLEITLTEHPPTQTPTVGPTMTTQERKAFVKKLLQTNAGCELPCWWGITPGVTPWQQAQSLLNKIAINIDIVKKGDTLQVAYVKIPSPIDVPYITYLEQTYTIRDGVVETIETYNFELTETYYLPKILNDYGTPSQVGIRTFRNEFNGSRPTGISIFYPKTGILIEYVGHKRVDTIGNKIQICPGGTYNFLYLWSPTLELTFDEAVNMFIDTRNMPPPISLEEATGMDVSTFYETYKNPNSTVCLETQADLWPKQ